MSPLQHNLYSLYTADGVMCWAAGSLDEMVDKLLGQGKVHCAGDLDPTLYIVVWEGLPESHAMRGDRFLFAYARDMKAAEWRKQAGKVGDVAARMFDLT